MDYYMDKEERRARKEAKEHMDMLGYVADAQFGIPTVCPCGARIINEIAAKEASSSKLPCNRYFTCKNYKTDGLHFRQPWIKGVEEECRKLNMQGEEAQKLSWHVYDMLRSDLLKLKEEVEQLKMQVADLERVM